MQSSDSSTVDFPFLGPDCVWLRRLGARTGQPRPALFLDRDGVIIEERHYLSCPDGVALIPEAAAVIAAHRSRGIAVVVITNQSGIGRGKFGWHQYAAVENRMLAMLVAAGAEVDLILACAHHPSGAQTPYNSNHPWRKPAPGMLLEAKRQLNLDLNCSVLVGDKASDIQSARAAGLPRAYHVATGYGKHERAAALALAGTHFTVIPAASIAHVRS